MNFGNYLDDEMLRVHLDRLSRDLKKHSIFGAVRSMNDLRYFMSWHVFAVWDFMSLVKRLQYEFTSVSLPWMPPSRPTAARQSGCSHPTNTCSYAGNLHAST